MPGHRPAVSGCWHDRASSVEDTLTAAAHRLVSGTVAVCVALVLFLGASQPAHACSCVRPENWGFIGPEDGRLPSNAAGVLWFKPRLQPQNVVPRITVEKWQEDRFQPTPATAQRVDGFHGIYLIAPQEGLAVGATYRFTDRGSVLDYDFPDWADNVRPLGSGPYRQVQVTVDAERLMADSPLTLKAGPATTEPMRVASGGGRCSVLGQPVPHVPIEAVLASDAQEWAGHLLFRTLVDDEPWAGAASLCSLHPSGRSWRQLAHDTVYSTCQAQERRGEAPIAFREPQGRFRTLTPNHHTLKMEALLPGSGIVLESQTVTVDLSCPPAAVTEWLNRAWFDIGPSSEFCECPGSLWEEGFIGEPEVRLPANAAGVPWFQVGLSGLVEPDPLELVGSRISVRMLNEHGEGSPLQTTVKAVPGFRHVFVVAPKDGFIAGARYFFVDQEHDDEWWRPSQLLELRGGIIATIDSRELSAEATLSLHSTPVVRETLRVSTASFSKRCSVVGRYPHVRIESRLEGAGQGWRDGLLFQTLFDGKPWEGARSSCSASVRWLGRSPAGAGQDVLYVPCRTEHQTSDSGEIRPRPQSGRHTVQMRAFLPGTDIVLDTETLTVDLSCPSPVEE